MDGLPDGVRAEPVTLAPEATRASLVLETAPDAAPAQVTASVEATAPGVTPARVQVGVAVASADRAGRFSLELTPSPLSIRAGQRDSVTITVSRALPSTEPCTWK